MAEVEAAAPGLRRSPTGVWAPRSCAPVSFPSNGHAGCLELEEDSFWFRHRNAVVLEAMARFPPAGTIWDVGGGNGYVTRALVDAGHEAVLLEPGAVGVRNARARGVQHIVCSTLQDAGILENALPAVGLFDVLEHIEREAEFLALLHSRMRPAARLYVTVPALGWLWSRADANAGHYRRYTRAALVTSLSAAGFHVEYASYCFSFLTLPILWGRTLRDWLPRCQPGLDLQERARNEHRPSSALVRATLAALTRSERAVIRRGGTLPVGTSCLAVATRAALSLPPPPGPAPPESVRA